MLTWQPTTYHPQRALGGGGGSSPFSTVVATLRTATVAFVMKTDSCRVGLSATEKGPWPREPYMTYGKGRHWSQIPWSSWNTLNDGAVAFIFKLCLTSVTRGWILRNLVCMSKFTVKLWKLLITQDFDIYQNHRLLNRTSPEWQPAPVQCLFCLHLMPRHSLSVQKQCAHEAPNPPPASNHVIPCWFSHHYGKQ